MLTIVKLLGAPGSIPFFAVSIVAGLALIRFTRTFRRVGLAWVLVVSAGYLILALPVVANTIADALPERAAHLDAAGDPATAVATVVVLDGDNRRGRVREIQRVLREKTPTTVWILGSRWILEALEEAGVPTSAFRYDGTSATTREQMDQLAEIVSAAPDSRTAVIASRLQAPRVAALIRTRALRATVLPSSVDQEPPTAGLAVCVPSYIALRVSRDAIYEHAALAFYRWRGWIE